MGCENSWSEDGKGLYKRMYGEVSVVDVLMENNDLFQNHHFEKLTHVIYDFRETTTEGTMTQDELASIAKVARLRANTKNALKVGIVSRNIPESINSAHTICDLLTGSSFICGVFLEPEEAKAWATS